MKILLTHRFFWPDTAPYAHMLRVIGNTLAGEGHEVHVLASVPSYREGAKAARVERLDALKVRRVRVFQNEKSNPLFRLANVVLYSAGLFAEILHLRPDVVTASTFPPVVAAWTASLAARLSGANFIYHVQDIHPEVSEIIGGTMGKSVFRRLFRGLDNQTLRRASRVVVVSQDMAETLRARGVQIRDLQVIDNLALDDDSTVALRDPTFTKAPDRLRVIFAGNLGRFQNLPLLAEGVVRLFPRFPALELCFLGDGPALTSLQEVWGDHPQVSFLPHVPVATARAILQAADVGLISLEPGMYRVAFPSKYQMYLSLGLPILALIEPESQMARQIRDGQQGAVSAAATPEAVAAALEEVVAGLPRRIAHDAEAARAAILASWRTLMAELDED